MLPFCRPSGTPSSCPPTQGLRPGLSYVAPTELDFRPVKRHFCIAPVALRVRTPTEHCPEVQAVQGHGSNLFRAKFGTRLLGRYAVLKNPHRDFRRGPGS